MHRTIRSVRVVGRCAQDTGGGSDGGHAVRPATERIHAGINARDEIGRAAFRAEIEIRKRPDGKFRVDTVVVLRRRALRVPRDQREPESQPLVHVSKHRGGRTSRR